MKTSSLSACLGLLAILLGGCIMGGSKDDDTSVDPQDEKNSGEPAKPIKPGYYRGNIEPIAPGSTNEPEIILNEDGTFRYLTVENNEVVEMLAGTWTSRQDSLFHDRLLGSATNTGYFEFWDTLSADTSIIRNVTDTSFERQQFLPEANQGFGKIVWVKYRLISYPILTPGRFELNETFNDTPFTVAFDLRDNKNFTLDISFNEKQISRNTADWWQLGSFIFTRKHTFFEPDSNQEMVAIETFDAETGYRVKDISANAFKVWNGVEWDEFKRVE